MNCQEKISMTCVLVAVFGCAYSFAQGCGAVMTKNYSSYETESQDGTGHIYSSVLIDGSATCEQTIECPCNSATHTPKSFNHLGSVGGWGSGTPQCVNCYLSYQNNESISATLGTDYLFQASTEVVCSIVGAFYNGFFPNLYISLADTTLQTVRDNGNGICTTNPDCTGNITPRCLGPGTIVHDGIPCQPGFFCMTLAVRTSLTGSYTCSQALCSPSNPPGPCTGK